MTKPPTLTPREIEVLELLEQGYASKKIADHLKIEWQSARRYLSILYKKLNVKNDINAVVWYIHYKYAQQSQAASGATPAPPMLKTCPQTPASPADFADFLAQYGLLATLGGMNFFIGLEPDKTTLPDLCSRDTWQWLLSGRFTAARAYADLHLPASTTASATASTTATTDTALIAAMLMLAGEAERSQPWVEAAAPAEALVLTALRRSLHDPAAWSLLHKLGNDDHHYDCAKHLAMVSLYYCYSRTGDHSRATACAEALMAEAQAIMTHLQGWAGAFHAPCRLPQPDKVSR